MKRRVIVALGLTLLLFHSERFSPLSDSLAASPANEDAGDVSQTDVGDGFQPPLIDMDLAQDVRRAVVQAADTVDEVFVVLVDDLAGDFFQDVFHGDQTGHAAIFVQYHEHVLPVALELLQEDVQSSRVPYR